MDYLSKLLNFIEKNLLKKMESLEPDTPLFTSEILDSFNLLRLLSFIEEEFNVKTEPVEIRLENFDTLTRIENFIQRKQRTS